MYFKYTAAIEICRGFKKKWKISRFCTNSVVM